MGGLKLNIFKLVASYNQEIYIEMSSCEYKMFPGCSDR